MVAITPDSPVAAVFGRSHAKRKLVEEGLGIRTVGELLHHLPAALRRRPPSCPRSPSRSWAS